jgi:hypothetical protein
LEFYAVTAEVIPVLLLVVGFQIRGWELRGWGRWRWFALAEFIFVVTAETHSLLVLEAEKTNWLDPTLELTAYFILMLTIGGALFPWWFGDPLTIGGALFPWWFGDPTESGQRKSGRRNSRSRRRRRSRFPNW